MLGTSGISMQPSENQVLGSKLTYDPSWTGPLNVKRSSTNPWMLIPFIIVLLNWIGVAIYAFVYGDLNNDIWSRFKITLRGDKWIIVGTWIFAVFLTLTFLIFLRIATKLTIYALCLAFLLIVFLTAYFYFDSIIGQEKINLDMVVILVVLIFFLLHILYASFVNRRFIPMACEIIKETIKAPMFFPSLMPWLLLLYGLSLVMTSFCLAVGACLVRIDQKLKTPFGFYCHLSNFLGCAWLILVFFAFFRVVISGTYGTWYWTRNKQEIPKFTPMRFIWITFRYHLGSVITGSILTHIGKFLVTFGVSHSNFADPTVDNEVKIIRKLKLFFQRCYNYTGRVSDLVYVYTALHGQGFCESAKNSFQLWRRNHTKFAAMDQFVRELIFLGIITISSLSLNLYTAWKYIFCGLPSMTGLLFIIFFVYFLINSIILLLEVAMDTVLICGLEDFEVNGNSPRPYYMSDKLKEMILQNRME